MHPLAEDGTPGRGLSRPVIRMLSGLEVGLFAGLPAVAWLLFHSWLRGEPWWAKLNVTGALFYGGSVYAMGLGRASLAGAALLVVGYGLLGAAFGLIARTRGVARNLMLGLLVALVWQLVWQQYLLRRLDPFAPAYFPPLSTLPAQLMFGIGLGRFSPRFQSLAAGLGDPSWAPVWRRVLPPQAASADAVQLVGPPNEIFVGPLPEISLPEALENAIPADSGASESKRSQETDC